MFASSNKSNKSSKSKKNFFFQELKKKDQMLLLNQSLQDENDFDNESQASSKVYVDNIDP